MIPYKQIQTAMRAHKRIKQNVFGDSLAVDTLHEVARWPIEGGDQHADGVSVGWSVEVVHDVNISPTSLVCFDNRKGSS